ncbi:MAG: hypothetical protein CVU62_01435 [Deltaproteobacteria bacterium HGW-Deltaproteobacteria-2]|jgi:hypothetical protein|nr:MAG: hypothetical protein CVU62_01435 [Deltaproteobacteria bacterium HGW-Deltaproteobacteria-2]
MEMNERSGFIESTARIDNFTKQTPSTHLQTNHLFHALDINPKSPFWKSGIPTGKCQPAKTCLIF